MNVAHWLARTGRIHANCDALFRGEEPVCDYREFARSAATIASNLMHRFKIIPGDRVAIFAGNSTDYLITLYALWFAGAVPVPINAKLHPREAAWIIENAQAKFVFVDEKSGTGLAGEMPSCVMEMFQWQSKQWHALVSGDYMQEPASRAATDLAWLFYTSGTTGKPKGVEISHANLHAMAHSYFVDVDTVNQTDAACYAAPISHGAGIYNFMHVMKGARHVVPVSGGFDPGEIFDIAKSMNNLHMFAAPTMVRRLVDVAKTGHHAFEGFKTIVYGGGPMYTADIIEAVDVMGPKFCQIYGQGESPMTITALSRDHVSDRTSQNWKERLASVGTAQSCVEVRIGDDEGNPLPSGEVGEILVRGAPVMNGYWRNKAATRKALKNGWLWTGDKGALDDDGFLTLKDRSRDVVISGGTNIYPREVEEVLLAHHDIHEAAVIGKPDEEWGEILVAFIVLRPGATINESQMDQHCLENIARFKRPKQYHFVDQLPKNNYGKILKTQLRLRLDTLRIDTPRIDTGSTNQ